MTCCSGLLFSIKPRWHGLWDAPLDFYSVQECPRMLDYSSGHPSNYQFFVSPKNEFPGEFDARISKPTLSEHGFGNMAVLSQLHVSLCNLLCTPFPPPLIMVFFCHIFLSPGCNRKKFINATMITPANVAPSPAPIYNLPDLKCIKTTRPLWSSTN